MAIAGTSLANEAVGVRAMTTTAMSMLEMIFMMRAFSFDYLARTKNEARQFRVYAAALAAGVRLIRSTLSSARGAL